MVKEYGKEVQEIVINMKDNIQMIKNQVMGFLLGRVEIFIKEIMNLMLEMDMDKCIGVMVVFIRANGKMVFSMGKDKFMFLVKVIKKVYLKKMY